MKVTDLMEKKVMTCSPATNLEEVARMMWDNDCGSIPVVDEGQRPIGIITDRDIAIGAVLNHRPLWELTAGEVNNSRAIHSCKTTDNIHEALETMKSKRVRRLPVTNRSGQLKGIISMDDLIIAATETKVKDELSMSEVMHTLQHLCSDNIHHGAAAH